MAFLNNEHNSLTMLMYTTHEDDVKERTKYDYIKMLVDLDINRYLEDTNKI